MMSFRGIVNKDGQAVAEFSDTVYVACTKQLKKQDPDGGHIDYSRLNAQELEQKIAFYTKRKKKGAKDNPVITTAKTALKELTTVKTKLKEGTLNLDQIPDAKTPEECGEKRRTVWEGYKVNLSTALAAAYKPQPKNFPKIDWYKPSDMPKLS